MNDRAATMEHQLRMRMLAVIEEVGLARSALQVRITGRDRTAIEAEFDRMQAAAHRVLEVIEQREGRAGH